MSLCAGCGNEISRGGLCPGCELQMNNLPMVSNEGETKAPVRELSGDRERSRPDAADDQGYESTGS